MFESLMNKKVEVRFAGYGDNYGWNIEGVLIAESPDALLLDTVKKDSKEHKKVCVNKKYIHVVSEL